LIKINLLAVDRDRTKRKAKFELAGQKLTIGCSLILVAAALGVGWWFWYLRGASADLDTQIAEAQRETQRLQNVIQQVQQFEGRKVQLQQRVSLIEQLRKGQYAPVHLLDEISKSLPDRLWLTDLTQTGQEFTLSGTTDSLTAVADFAANLQSTRWFKPVEIGPTKVTTDAKSGDLIRFEIKATFVDPTAPPEPPAAAKGGAGRGAGRGK
jgi:type IV pilus assembly protein PilN